MANQKPQISLGFLIGCDKEIELFKNGLGKFRGFVFIIAEL